MGQTAEVTIDDLIADWRVRRNALDREIAFTNAYPGLNPALPLKRLRHLARDLDRLIRQHAHA